MTRFEWFELGYGQEAMNLGIISPSVFYRYIQYKVFLELRAKGLRKEQAYAELEERFKTSRATICRSISFFRIG
jgi:hypothetical protein